MVDIPEHIARKIQMGIDGKMEQFLSQKGCRRVGFKTGYVW